MIRYKVITGQNKEILLVEVATDTGRDYEKVISSGGYSESLIRVVNAANAWFDQEENARRATA